MVDCIIGVFVRGWGGWGGWQDTLVEVYCVWGEGFLKSVMIKEPRLLLGLWFEGVMGCFVASGRGMVLGFKRNMDEWHCLSIRVMFRSRFRGILVVIGPDDESSLGVLVGNDGFG